MANSRKRLLSVIAISMAVSFMFLGCSGSKSNANATGAGSKSNVTLSVVMAKGWEKSVMLDLFQKYTDKTGVKFDVQVLPDDKASEIIKTKFATDEFPDIMLNSASVTELTYMLPEQKLVDLTSEPWVDTLIDKTAYMQNGKIYGLPLWSEDYWGFAINTKVFKSLNISTPKNKAEFLTALETLKAHHIQPMYLGSKDPWMDGNVTSSCIWAATQQDPDLINKLNTNKIKYADIPSVIHNFQDIRTYNEKGYFGVNTMADSWDGQFEAFAHDKIGVCVGLTSWVSEIETKFPGSADKIEFIPYYIGDNTTIFAGTMGEWYVPKIGKHIDVVKDFFNFATQKDILDAYYTKLESISPFKNVQYHLPKAAQALADKINSGEYKTHLSHNSLVKAQDWDGLCRLAQEIVIGTQTPLEAAQAYDVMRAKIAKSIGLQGF